MAGMFALMAAASSGIPAHAQARGEETGGSGRHGEAAAICDSLPSAAARSVPAPFDGYMRLVCRDPVGQGLQPADGYHWTMPDGAAIGLTALSMVERPDPGGSRRFPASWYVDLSPVTLSLAEQRRLKRELGRTVRTRLLAGSTVLELRARTSNREEKLVVLVVPDAGRVRPAWLIGLECNGTCFRQDASPLIFAGSPG